MSNAAAYRALVADPSTHMAALAATMLRGLKFRTIDATLDLAQTAESLRRFPYALVLIDEKLGGPAGYALIRALRTSSGHANRTTPIFMMAAAPGAAMISQARDAGITEFLRTPFSADDVRVRLDTFLTSPRPFVEADSFTGPDRRRHRETAEGEKRRASDRSGS